MQFGVKLTHDHFAVPTVYFLAPDRQAPSGGRRVIYRHVDILNAHGVSASVLHHRAGFSYNWFEHKTRIADVSSATVRAGDLIVVPEVDCDLIPRLPLEVRYVIFNQNSHLTWSRVKGEELQRYMCDPRLAAVATVSAHNQAMLERAFPNSPITRIRISIDPAMFNALADDRPRRITYMPRRGREDAEQVLEILRVRGVLDGWDVAPLDWLTHEEVGAALRCSRIFLAFTYQEGFGLPAAEAMACGNYTIGNDGFAGREFFRPEFSARVETGDILGFVDAVEGAIRNEHSDPNWCRTRGRLASEYVIREYSPSHEIEDVVALYGGLIGRSEAAEHLAEHAGQSGT
jgi:Glycosyl transferases group 1